MSLLDDIVSESIRRCERNQCHVPPRGNREATVPEIVRRDVIVRRSDFLPLARGESLPIEGTDITITLSEEARVIAALIESAELTDPRGVLDARLKWLERTVRAFLFDQSPENLEQLEIAFDGCFVP